jgi:4'-phosphopantetheinyl transferase
MALVYLRELDPQVRFAIWRVEEEAEDLVGRLQLDEREKTVLAGLNKGKRTLHWLTTRVLLRYMLDTPGFIDCPSDENGKPYLANFPHKISLTHSFDYVAVMLSENGEVGIDLELVGSKILKIAHKFMKTEELVGIEELDVETRINYLYACWCAKEAVYKLQGNKGVSFRENMNISPFEYLEQGVLTLELQTTSIHKTFKVHYERFLDYMLGYVVDSLYHAEQ